MSVVDWGDVPTWVAAVFAGGAASFAYQTIKSQREQIGEQRQFIAEQSANLALERAELQATLEDRKSEQAMQVSMKAYVRSTGTQTDNEGNQYPSGPKKWMAQLQNDSRQPLRDVTVRVGDLEMPSAHRASVREAGGAFTMAGVRRVGDPVDAPVAVVSGGALYLFDSGPLAADPADLDRPVAYFTDNEGVRWRLDDHGDLREVP